MKTTINLSDTELFNGCLKQDPHIQKEVYKRFSRSMYALCLRYVREMAVEDLMKLVDSLPIGYCFTSCHWFFDLVGKKKQKENPKKGTQLKT